MMQFIFIFCLLFNLTSAVKITHVALKADEVKIESGSWLIIPCHFTTDTGFKLRQLNLEWGVISSESYTPIIILSENNLMKLGDTANRAYIFPSDFPYGNCTLVINPINVDDNGIYQVRLSADGEVYEPAPKVKVTVSSSDSLLEDLPQERAMQLPKEKKRCNELDPLVWSFAHIFQGIKKTIVTPKLTIFEALIGALMFAFIVSGVVAWFLYYRLKLKQLYEEMQRENELKEVKVKPT